MNGNYLGGADPRVPNTRGNFSGRLVMNFFHFWYKIIDAIKGATAVLVIAY